MGYENIRFFSSREEVLRKRLRIVLAMVFAIIFAVGVDAYANAKSIFPPNDDGHLTAISLSKEFRHLPSKESAYSVSIVQYDASHCLIAGYMAGLHMVDLRSGDLRLIQPENIETCEVMGGKDSFADRKIWNPTGLHFDRRKKLLYVANYTGHNILVGKVTDRGTFAVEKMIVAEGLTSPENVAVNEKGTRIAAADYDGNNVFLFDEQGNVLWRKDVPLAHGVEISNSSVYGTSLGKREIIQFDYQGNEIKRVGRCANRGTDAYMWPTCLELYKGKLIVTDPHTGRLTVLNDKLEYETALGMNGPYATNFNYPYSAMVADDRIYVTDTYANRILIMDLEGTGMAQISKEAPRMPPAGSPPYVPEYPFDMAYLYEEQMDIAPSFFGKDYGNDMKVVAGYSSFWLAKGDKKIQIPMLTYSSIPSWQKFCSTYFYDTWSKMVATKEHKYLILGSPQSSSCIVFSFDVGVGSIVNLGTVNTFCIHGKMIGDRDCWETMLHDMDLLTDTFSNKISEGQTRYQAYIDTFIPYYYKFSQPTDGITPEAELAAWLEFQCTQTESSKAIYVNIRQGTLSAEAYKSYMEDCYLKPYNHSIFERLMFRTFVKDLK